MTGRIPPAPPENRSPKGTGEKKVAAADEKAGAAAANPEKQGQSGNTKINTTHQGYQQDR
ncbi:MULTISPECIES: hypothetical protein [Phyllobacteriaceae]|uniref:Uncharacterized protein n=1 Tax=Phyllobacterium phragmitis TaxID=2670329 RepID=A0ABQ0GUM8_9HYPH|nr:hypothetical protein [Mesorhizobium sp. RMAD-H1]MBB2972352.1 hypothetical protein [Mesorhizobium sp. RMAD-H1]